MVSSAEQPGKSVDEELRWEPRGAAARPPGQPGKPHLSPRAVADPQPDQPQIPSPSAAGGRGGCVVAAPARLRSPSAGQA